MKFVIAAVVLLAVTMGVQSSVILGAGPTLQQGPIVIGWGASVPVAANIDVASIVGVPGATYVAKTLGAVHAAPLPGHTQSAVAVNVNPAPGTL
ncbi:adult cuticle protein 1-like [Episyrphus balteatus]|uniref:adult cuticle protein 1-like n=1 Tax=Episyrphus balteatus TaxID=286459 RepID=UPI0024851D8A|nr:adult cuticle protein 1-like [Episyrphus balteatus]